MGWGGVGWAKGAGEKGIGGEESGGSRWGKRAWFNVGCGWGGVGHGRFWRVGWEMLCRAVGTKGRDRTVKTLCVSGSGDGARQGRERKTGWGLEHWRRQFSQ